MPNEWQQHDDILKRQILELRDHEEVAGFSIFSYNSLFQPASENAQRVTQELENLQKLMIKTK